jgi:hypothetical protein
MSLTKDAIASGMGVGDFRRELTRDFHARSLPGPGEVPVDWQLATSLHRVQLPANGWWVLIDCPPTLNVLSELMGGSVDQLTLGHVCGDNRVPVQNGLRTLLVVVEPPGRRQPQPVEQRPQAHRLFQRRRLRTGRDLPGMGPQTGRFPLS